MSSSGNNLTICIVTHNDVAVIPATLNSIVGDVFQVAVIDRGSKDGTQRVAREFDATVYDMTSNSSNEQAWKQAIKLIESEWILKLNPAQLLSIADPDQLLSTLDNTLASFFLVPEYESDDLYNYYYRPVLLRNSQLETYDPILDEFNLIGGKLITGIGISYTCNDEHRKYLQVRLDMVKTALESDPKNITYLYRNAYLCRRLNLTGQFQKALQDGIRIMTECDPENILNVPAATSLFGYYAESLSQLEHCEPSIVESLLNLQKNLPVDVRLNRSLAQLLDKQEQPQIARQLLEDAIQTAVQPSCQTITHKENFIYPIVDLLALIRRNKDEDALVEMLLKIHVLCQKWNFDSRSLFKYLHVYQNEFFSRIETNLKRILKEIHL